MASTIAGSPPLQVTLDASSSHAASGSALIFAWDFGDGTPSPPPAPGDDPGAALLAARDGYTAAKAERDDGHFDDAVRDYTATALALVALSVVELPGPITTKGTNRIDRVARWYLQKTAHDLGAIYLFHDIGDVTGCDRYALALQWSRESVTQAIAGGFPDLPAANGTTSNIDKALQKLADGDCDVPDPMPMLPQPGALPKTGAVVEHVYQQQGIYTARVTVSAGDEQATAGGDDHGRRRRASSAPRWPLRQRRRRLRGLRLDDARRSRRAHHRRHAGDRGRRAQRLHRRRRPARDHPVRYRRADRDPQLAASPHRQLHHGRGQRRDAVRLGRAGFANLIDMRGHDVIVRNIHLRSGSDNLRAQDPTAYNVVFSHISSTGSGDDGISIGYGAHDVTVQWCFLAGDTRSMFLKYDSTTNVSFHHSWVQKQWSRGPMVSSSVMADVRNVIVEDWTMWGIRFEADSSGNMVNSLFALGPYARSVGGKANSALRLSTSQPVFATGNVYQGLADAGVRRETRSAPYPAAPVTTLSVTDMVPRVRTRAGCLPRDAVDQAYIDESGRLGRDRDRAAADRSGVVARRGSDSLARRIGERVGPPTRRGTGRQAERSGARGAPNDPELSHRAEGNHRLARAASARADALVGGCTRRSARAGPWAEPSHARNGVHSDCTEVRDGRMRGRRPPTMR